MKPFSILMILAVAIFILVITSTSCLCESDILIIKDTPIVYNVKSDYDTKDTNNPNLYKASLGDHVTLKVMGLSNLVKQRKKDLSKLVNVNIFTYAEQKDTSITDIKYLQLNVSGSGCHIFESENVKAEAPDFLAMNYPSDLPKSYITNIPVRDNPLNHSAFYFDVNLTTTLCNLKLNLDLVAEHRGVSYGIFNSKAMVIFPKYKVEFDTCFSLLKENFRFGTTFGNVENSRLYEGLTVYNLDYQSIEVFLKWNKFKLKYHQIGDLYQYIGLNIDDLFNLTFSIEDIHILNDFYSNIEIGKSYIPPSLIQTDNLSNQGLNFSANIKNNNLKLYSQYSIRQTESNISLNLQSGFLAGFVYKFNNNNFDINLLTEYRYYGSFFNRNYSNRSMLYRMPEKTWVYKDNNIVEVTTYPEYNNTIGKNLYPLYLYDRPFSQWAVFTEYQNKNVTGLIFQFICKYKLDYDFIVVTDFDFNFIKASGVPSFIYPFYNIGFGWEPDGKYNFVLSITNKGMNLDKHYPTFYLYQSLQLKLSFKYNLND